MQWVILALVVFGLLLMSTRYPKVAFAILGALLLLIGGLLMLNTRDEKRASSRATQLELLNHKMSPGYADSYNFSGRISNNSESIVRETTIQVTLKDCSTDEDSSCSVIGEEVARIPLTIPPGQARDFEENVYLGPSKPEYEVRWEYLILDAKVR